MYANPLAEGNLGPATSIQLDRYVGVIAEEGLGILIERNPGIASMGFVNNTHVLGGSSRPRATL